MSKRLWVSSCCVISLLGLFLGGQLTVDSSTKIASSFGINETIIGLTVVSIATTLPELITSIMAVKKNETDIVLGNCIGSNLFNILLVLGLSAVINPIVVQQKIATELIIMIVLTIFLFIISILRKKVTKAHGFVRIACYIAFISFSILNAYTVV